MDKTLQTRNVQMLSNLGNGLKEQFELQSFCDVTLTTTNHDSSESGQPESSRPSVECHKVVLAATTKHFDNYLKGRGNEVNIIDVSPMHIDILKETLTYLYNGECLINERNVFDLLDTANAWVILELATDCCRFFINAKTTGNACKFYEKLIKSDLNNTSVELRDFIREHFNELYENQQIACLSLASFNNVIAVDVINVDNEDMIFDAALLVIKSLSGAVDPEDLQKCWKLIHVELMSVTYLVERVMYHKLLRDAPQNKYVKQAITQIHEDSANNTIRTQRALVRSVPMENGQKDMGMFAYINEHNMVCALNSKNNKWEEVMSAPDWVDDTTVVHNYPGGLIVAGKECQFDGNKMSLLYLRDKCEIQCPNLQSCMYGHFIQYCSVYIYIFGGNVWNRQMENWIADQQIWKLHQNDGNWIECGWLPNFLNPIPAAIDCNPSCYAIDPDTSRYMKFNFTKDFWTGAQGVLEVPRISIYRFVIHLGELKTFMSNKIVTYQKTKAIIKQYKQMDGLQVDSVMIYKGDIHAYVTVDEECKIMKYNSENNSWCDTMIPRFPKNVRIHYIGPIENVP